MTKPIDALPVRKFINKHRNIIYGMLCGDAYICDMGKSALFGVNHSQKQKDYLFHKYKMMEEMCCTPPTFYTDRRGERYGSWNFRTRRTAEWQRVWSVFHQDSKATVRYGRKFIPKVLTPQILKELDDHSVAIIFMDEGYLARYVQHGKPQYDFRVATCKFTREENEVFLEWFKGRYGVGGRIWINQNRAPDGTKRFYPYLAFKKEDFLKIFERIKGYVHPSMMYKFQVHVPSQGSLPQRADDGVLRPSGRPEEADGNDQPVPETEQ